MKAQIEIDLDFDAPEKVADALRQIADAFDVAADNYRESVSELQAAWTDPNAGIVWGHLANRMNGTAGLLRKQAGACDNAVRRFV